MTDAERTATLRGLPQELQPVLTEAAALAKAAEPLAAEADESSAIHPGMRELLRGSGLASVVVPRAYGGRFEQVDPLAVAVVREQLASSSVHLDTLFALQGIGSFAIARAGTDTIRRRWLPSVARLEAVAALAMTEPEIGSDLKAIGTEIVRDGDELVVTGHKSFITNGGEADFYCTFGREGDGYSLVVVPADSAGLSTSRPHQIIAPHVLGDVVFDEVRVPVDHRVGEAGKAFSLVLATLATFRVSVAGAALGVATAALEEAIHHTTSRRQFGQVLAELGPVPTMLAQCWTDIEASRSLTYRAATAARQDPLAALHLSSMAKVDATEVAGQVVDRCVQVMGRFGLARGSRIERMYRAARPLRIYEGSTEVILGSLAKQLVKSHQAIL